MLRGRLPALSASDPVRLVRDLEIISGLKIAKRSGENFGGFVGVFEGCFGKSGVFSMVNSW
jgi:hypothetical protein